MQMFPDSFWHRYSFAEFQIKAFFFFKNRGDDFKDRWHQTRKLAHIAALVGGAKVEAEDVVPLPWDHEANEPKSKPMTAKEGADVIAKYQKLGLFKNQKHKLN
jgi:hypothetical protein